MIMLDKETVKEMYDMIIDATGGLYGLRDEGALDSSLSAAFQTMYGEDLFPTVIEKIARIAYGLVSNHPFADGNKRIGTLVMLTLLDLNGINIEFTDDEVIRIGLDLASGKMDYEQLHNTLLTKIE